MTQSLSLMRVVVCCLLAAHSYGQSVRVRAIDAKTARPIVGKVIRVQLFDGPPIRQRPGYLEEKTGPDGTASFHISGSIPLTINVSLKGGHWMQCSPYTYLAQDVMRSGAVIENQCGKPADISHRYSAKPGEVVIFARHWVLFNPEVHYPM